MEEGDQTTRSCATGPVAKPPSNRKTHSALDEVGSLSDRYVVLETIGRGGMGTVVRAFDSKLRREVALKLLRASNLGGEAQARMIREAQAMAQLSHPNVVGVYDVCLEGNTVAIAMEYVAGEPLNAWLKRRKRAWSEIVARFLDAGRGLEAAHAIGLIHRDFKPTNVLVGDDHRVRVSDFGLAKTTDEHESRGTPELEAARPGSGWDPLTATLTHTDVVVGTPRYMAPEQHTRATLDARTDQYAFCVALWEALNGRSPFTGPDLVKAKRSGPPEWHNGAIPGHIARAVERGMAAAPDKRWPSMTALLHHLSRAPRWKSIAATTGAAIAAVIGTSAWVGAEEPSHCDADAEALAELWDDDAQQVVAAAFASTGRSYATSAAADATDRLDVYVAEWTAESRALCAASDGLRKRTDVIDYRAECLERARNEAAAAMTVLRDADENVVQRASTLLRGLPDPTRCAESNASLPTFSVPSSPILASAVAQGRKTLATARSLNRVGKLEEAHQALVDADLVVARQHPAFATEESRLLGRVLNGLGRYDDSEAAFQSSLALALEENLVFDASLAATALAKLLAGSAGRPEEGIQLGRVGVALSRSITDDGPFEAKARKALSDALRHAGQAEAAESELRAAFELVEGSASILQPADLADMHISMGFLLEDKHQMSEAEFHQRKSLEILTAASPPGHPHIGVARHNFSQILRRLERLDDAEATAQSAIELLEGALGESHSTTLLARDNLAAIYLAQGRLDDARVLFEANLDGFEVAFGPEHPQVAAAATNLGMVLSELGDHAGAELQHRRAERLWLATMGSDNPRLAVILDNLAAAIAAQGRVDEAALTYQRALSLREKALGEHHLDVATTLLRWSRLLHAQGHHAQANTKLTRAHAILDASEAPASRKAELAFLLAQVRHTLDPTDTSIDGLLRSADASYEAAGAASAQAHEDLRAWMAAHRSPTD